jgi:hypothetical protein
MANKAKVQRTRTAGRKAARPARPPRARRRGAAAGAIRPRAAFRAVATPPTGELHLTVFDGTREPISNDVELLVRIIDGDQRELHADFHKSSSLLFELPLQNNLADNFTVLVSADDFAQSGFTPINLRAGLPAALDLMLLPKNPTFDFEAAQWTTLEQTHPALVDLFAHGADSPAAARDRYEALMADRPKALADLLNLTTAMRAILLPQLTPLDYFKELIWDDSMAQDRFFGFADAALVRQIELARAQGTFEPEFHPSTFHPGATRSFKQVQFGEANVQLTLHENDKDTIDGVACVKIEPDIDFFKDPLSHAILEVIPGFFSLTDPVVVYVLRWIAGRHAGVPEFDPPYTIVAA